MMESGTTQIMIRFQVPDVFPCGGQVVLQTLLTFLADFGEEISVTAEPCLLWTWRTNEISLNDEQ